MVSTSSMRNKFEEVNISLEGGHMTRSIPNREIRKVWRHFPLNYLFDEGEEREHPFRAREGRSTSANTVAKHSIAIKCWQDTFPPTMRGGEKVRLAYKILIGLAIAFVAFFGVPTGIALAKENRRP